MDEDLEAGRKCMAELGSPFRSAFDGGGWAGATAKAFGVNSIPRTVLVGPDGRVLHRMVILESLFGEPKSSAGAVEEAPE